jgi:hypothetical protein
VPVAASVKKLLMLMDLVPWFLKNSFGNSSSDDDVVQ